MIINKLLGCVVDTKKNPVSKCVCEFFRTCFPRRRVWRVSVISFSLVAEVVGTQKLQLATNVGENASESRRMGRT